MKIRNLVLSFSLVTTAPAATISFTVTDLINRSNIRISLDSGATYAEDLIGAIKITKTATTVTPAASIPTVSYVFCAEPEQGITIGSSYTHTFSALSSVAPTASAPTGIGAVRASLLGELYARYYSNFLVPNQVVVLPGISSSAIITAGALQLATWELIRETSGTYNVSTGSTRFLNSVTTPNANYASIISTANTMLSSLTGSGPIAQNLYSLTNVQTPTARQDLVFQTVPEPGSVVLLVSGLGLVLRSRRRREQARV